MPYLVQCDVVGCETTASYDIMTGGPHGLPKGWRTQARVVEITDDPTRTSDAGFVVTTSGGQVLQGVQRTLMPRPTRHIAQTSLICPKHESLPMKDDGKVPSWQELPEVIPY